MNCLNCQKEFVPQRSTAKFCSTKCRVAFNSVSVVSVSDDKIIVNNPLSVSEPQETEIVSVNKYKNMNDKELLEEADLMATRDYLARGWFGGKAFKDSKGRVTDRKYFPFDLVKTKYFNWLKKEQFKTEKEIKEEIRVSQA